MLSKSGFVRNEDTDGDQMVAVYQIDEEQYRGGICHVSKLKFTVI
ncbi:MAG: hypothetical protein WBB48_01230 [Thermodesulfobacteriota bacterium]